MNKDNIEQMEDRGLIGPGLLLSEARKKQNLSIEYVADKLNFRTILVKNIESDIYDQSLPDTYNRGYIKNYAKLVGLSPKTVIECYEKLNVLQENGTKMQSFSRGTFKRAENSKLMWITYFILAVFVGLTMMWWLQDSKSPRVTTANVDSEQLLNSGQAIQDSNNADLVDNMSNEQVLITQATIEKKPAKNSLTLERTLVSKAITTDVEAAIVINEVNEKKEPINTVFTFSGDCWVNITDATGERIAWGIKKSGYIMSIEGKLPLNITIGKPELVEINFKGENVDMSAFGQGHIARFTLPISPELPKNN